MAGSGHTPYPVFAQALEAGSVARVLNIARDMPTIRLSDALRIVYLLRDDVRYEKFAVRWIVRFGAEGRAVDTDAIVAAGLALQALARPPGFGDAAASQAARAAPADGRLGLGRPARDHPAGRALFELGDRDVVRRREIAIGVAAGRPLARYDDPRSSRWTRAG